MDLLRLAEPIVQAPMAGGPSTPALAAAVAAGGGLGFLAAGYLTPAAVREQLATARGLMPAPFGVNLFAPPAGPSNDAAVAAYAERLRAEAARHGVELGAPRSDDDHWREKLELVAEERVAVVSFTFGCPPAAVVDDLHAAGCAVWVTVTDVDEAVAARQAGADALIAQGFEAGGHRASFSDGAERQQLGLLALLQVVRREVGLPLVAAGGIATGDGVAAALCAGASAAQIGSALMRTPEAGTSPAHRAALAEGRPTRLTRAFSGRQARGIVNRFMEEHDDAAPSAYPQVHHLTAPLRAAARGRGDAEAVNLWAGQAHGLAEELPAAELVRRLGAEARAAIARVTDRLAPG